jgi:hypothetical protein
MDIIGATALSYRYEEVVMDDDKMAQQPPSTSFTESLSYGLEIRVTLFLLKSFI